MSPGRGADEELAAGGVVVRRATPGPDGAEPRAGWEVLLGEQHDRNTDRVTVRLPKGHLDPGESAEDAAVREVLEETGRRAVIRVALPDVRYEYYERSQRRVVPKRVLFYLMDDAGPGGERDGEMARVFWCAIDEAERRLTFHAEQGVVSQAARILGIG